MNKRRRKRYAKEFKQGAFRLVVEQGYSIADAAKSLGMPVWSLSRWVRNAKREGRDAFRDNGKHSRTKGLLNKVSTMPAPPLLSITGFFVLLGSASLDCM